MGMPYTRKMQQVVLSYLRGAAPAAVGAFSSIERSGGWENQQVVRVQLTPSRHGFFSPVAAEAKESWSYEYKGKGPNAKA